MTTDEHTTTEFDSNSIPGEDLPPSIVQIYGGQIGRRFELGKRDITIGRGASNVVVIDLSTVSRHHARMYQDGAQCYVEDLGSTNGSFVNGKRVEGSVEVQGGDLIKLGGAVFKFIEGGNTEALYYEEIYRLTIIDGLTQIPNKRYLIDFLEREMARAKRHHRPLYLAMVDIDHFK
ncbi:MAG: FHA domain-containing protein, partial [Acidobacteria bacterium]|nr:FHA domain-containing protein [Acidobacteriota bacterium]